MKIPTSLAIIAALCVVFTPVSLLAEAVVGEPAPDFALEGLDGEKYRLGDLRGKTVVLEWFNPDCPFVKKHYRSGNLPKLQKSATGDGAVWLTINSARKGGQGDYDAEKAAAWLKQMEAAPTNYARDRDGTVGRAYGAKTSPHMYVINPQGVLVYNGAIDSIPSADVKDIARAEDYVTAALAAVKSGRSPAKARSEPYGCSVKY